MMLDQYHAYCTIKIPSNSDPSEDIPVIYVLCISINDGVYLEYFLC